MWLFFHGRVYHAWLGCTEGVQSKAVYRRKFTGTHIHLAENLNLSIKCAVP
jgi:hypothetical protein